MDIFTTFFNLAVLQRSLPLLLSGLWITLELGIVSIIAGLVGGLILALLRLYATPFVRSRSPRSTSTSSGPIPLLVLLIVIYYALPFVGIRLSPFLSAASALTLVSTAYTAEIFRAGIEAIPRGQFEASEALGLSYRHMMVEIILPQAIKIVIPPLTNNCINVMKDTALWRRWWPCPTF
jgi:polar amino acid transport system permease protein